MSITRIWSRAHIKPYSHTCSIIDIPVRFDHYQSLFQCSIGQLQKGYVHPGRHCILPWTSSWYLDNFAVFHIVALDKRKTMKTLNQYYLNKYKWVNDKRQLPVVIIHTQWALVVLQIFISVAHLYSEFRLSPFLMFSTIFTLGQFLLGEQTRVPRKKALIKFQ